MILSFFGGGSPVCRKLLLLLTVAAASAWVEVEPKLNGDPFVLPGAHAADGLVVNAIPCSPFFFSPHHPPFGPVLCACWAIEALTRAGQHDAALLKQARVMFEDLVGYSNHVGLFSEEISKSGEALGNTPQAFTHVSLISAAFNLNRVLSNSK